MPFVLRVGHRFRVSSAMCQRYEEDFGPFTFVVEVVKLYRRRSTPLEPPPGDLHLTCVDPDRGAKGQLPFACDSIAGGHDLYSTRDYNWSPDLINGEGQWYLPELFRWQHKWIWLVGNDVVEFLG